MKSVIRTVVHGMQSVICTNSCTQYVVCHLYQQLYTVCSVHVAGHRPATSWGVHYTTSCNTQSSAPEDG